MMRVLARTLTLVLMLFVSAAGCQSPAKDLLSDEAATAATKFDSAEIAAFMDSFHAALAAGDSVAVVSHFAEEVDIVEGGNVQSRLEYFSGHFRGDASFLSALEREPLFFTTRNRGNTVTVISTSRLTGTRGEREINMISAETAVLGKTDDGWVILSLHWSSGRR